jgi:hypothetical protein
MPTYKIIYLNNLFSKKKLVYYAFIAQEVQKKTFFECIFNQKLKFFNDLKFDLCTSISLTTKKFITKFHI